VLIDSELTSQLPQLQLLLAEVECVKKLQSIKLIEKDRYHLIMAEEQELLLLIQSIPKKSRWKYQLVEVEVLVS
jgi:hypothetical protein